MDGRLMAVDECPRRPSVRPTILFPSSFAFPPPPPPQQQAKAKERRKEGRKDEAGDGLTTDGETKREDRRASERVTD